MSLFIQYHNYDKEGLPLGDLGIHSRLAHVRDSVGGQVFLIFGIGRPRRYYLWNTFRIDKVRPFADDDGGKSYHAFGPGWYLSPPQRLDGKNFQVFKQSCANFVGFFKIDEMPFAGTLKKLAVEYQEPRSPNDIPIFIEELEQFLEVDTERTALADHFATPKEQRAKDNGRLDGGAAQMMMKPLGVRPAKSAQGKNAGKTDALIQPQMKALSIRQPHAEAILRGIKKIEFRSRTTKIRGRISIYASLGRYSPQEEADMLKTYRIRDVACDDLPRGVIVGSVELFDCDGGDWKLRNPERASKLLKPKNHPQPVWFHPF